MVLFALVVLGMMRLYPLGLVGMAPAEVATGPSAWRVLRPRTRTLHLESRYSGARPHRLGDAPHLAVPSFLP
jgi:hypothetical protein